ncbi:MAG: response regulator transcription factor [Bacteroidales bacterium]|nr:response regulator transcription factor [Bacteroidales bacterium]
MDDKLARILVVEDDATLSEMLQFNLEIEGYKADVVHSAEEALNLDLSHYSLILLDMMMGEMSGFAFARKLKADPYTAHVPIIFCTARDNEDDMVKGLALGADDYIYKPYSLRNVMARIEAVLRRTAHSSASDASESLTYEGLYIDRRFKRCIVDGQEVKLVKKEFEILELLMSYPGRIFSREEILQRVWKGEVVVLERTVDVNITRVRQKIAPYGEHVVTRSGFGYGFI